MRRRRPPPLIAALGAILSWIWRALTGPRLPYGWSREFIASPAFLDTQAWAETRYIAINASKRRCELCGRGKAQGVWIDVDHIKPRHLRPDLALDPRNLQILCGDAFDASRAGAKASCNRGKGRRHQHDHRPADHPHRT
jgi:hypothetical protein